MTKQQSKAGSHLKREEARSEARDEGGQAAAPAPFELEQGDSQGLVALILCQRLGLATRKGKNGQMRRGLSRLQ